MTARVFSVRHRVSSILRMLCILLGVVNIPIQAMKVYMLARSSLPIYSS